MRALGYSRTLRENFFSKKKFPFFFFSFFCLFSLGFIGFYRVAYSDTLNYTMEKFDTSFTKDFLSKIFETFFFRGGAALLVLTRADT